MSDPGNEKGDEVTGAPAEAPAAPPTVAGPPAAVAPPLEEASITEPVMAAPPDEPPPPDEEPSLEGVNPSEAPARIRGIVESLLFAADRPVTIKQLKEILGERDGHVVRAALAALRASESEERGLVLHEVAGGFQLRTNPDNAPWVARLLQARPVRLTRASLECLSIVAYRQPVTRADVEDVRGVDSGGVLKLLLDRNLIRILGKKEEPGRPLLYGTTKEFLAFFNLRDLRDLPTLRDYSELSEEHRLKVETLHGAAPEAPPDGPPPPPLAPGERPHLTLVPGEPAVDEGAADAAPPPPAGLPVDAGETPVDATAATLAQAAVAAAERAAARERAHPPRPEHEDEAARDARLRREHEYAEVDDKLVGELEAAMQQAQRIRREIDPPKPRAPRVPVVPLPDGTVPPAEGPGASDQPLADGAGPEDDGALLDDAPPDGDEPPPVC